MYKDNLRYNHYCCSNDNNQCYCNRCCGTRGPQGPTGPQGEPGPQGEQGEAGLPGENGADGIIGSITATVATIAELPTTGVAQGEIYYVEEDGSIYIFDNGNWVKLNAIQGPRGPEGPQGEKGEQGEDGIVGSINGVVATVADLPSTGAIQGEIYYVEENEKLYVWDETAGWTELGSIQGPRGPEGPQGEPGPQGEQGEAGLPGENGADGIIGSITATVATIAELPTTGVAQGDIYYVEEDGSIYIFDNGNWVRLNAIQGPRGPEGPQGEKGEQGEDGIVGSINGVVATVAELPTTGVTQGDIYYVEEDGNIYVFDNGNWVRLNAIQGPRGPEGTQGEPGPQGEAGPAGPAASSYMIVPFASTEAPLSHFTNGNPSRVSLLGFGYGDRRDFGLLTAAEYSIAIDASDFSFSLTNAAGNSNKQMVFSLPFDVSIRSIYATVGNYGMFTPTSAIFPYIQLYQAQAGSNNFTVIENAFAIPEQGIGPGTNVPADTMRSALTEGLDIKLPAGTRIAIGALVQVPGYTGGSNQYWLYFTGGIGLTYEPRV